MVNAISNEHSIFQLRYLGRKERLWDLFLAFNSEKKTQSSKHCQI